MKTESRWITIYGLEVFQTFGHVKNIFDGKRHVYPYKKVFDGVYYRWKRWENPPLDAFRRALYSGRACVGPIRIYEDWKTVNATRKGRFLFD